MLSAMDFLPLIITWFINFARVTLPYFGSGNISRLATTLLLGILIASLQEFPRTTLRLALLGSVPKTYLPTPYRREPGPLTITWDAWRRIWSGLVYAWQHRRYPVNRVQCGNAHRGGP